MSTKRAAEGRPESPIAQDRPQHDRWTLAALAVMEKKATVTEAARQYNVSRDSIYLRLEKGTTDIKRGRPSLVDDDIMEGIIAWVRVRTRFNKCVDEVEVMESAEALARGKHDREEVSFSITTKRRIMEAIKAEGINLTVGIGTQPSRMEANNVANYCIYFDKVDAFLEAFPILRTEPWRLCSLDESPSIYNAEKSRPVTRVLFDPAILKGQTPRRESISNGSNNLTLMSAICADGSRIDNAYFFKGKQMQMSWISGPYPACLTEESLGNVSFFATPAGGVTQETFYAYLKEHLIPRLRKRSPQGPLLLFFDAPGVHQVTEQVDKLFKEKGVHWVCFPAYSSHRLDPLDVQPFKEVKRGIREIMSNVSTVYSNQAAVLDNSLRLSIKAHAEPEQEPKERALGFDGTLNTRTIFLMTETVFALRITSSTVREGFIKAGLCPFDPVRVLEHCRDWEEMKAEYEKMHGHQVRSSRSVLTKSLRESLTEANIVIQDLTLTEAARMTRLRDIVTTACVPINLLEAAGAERAKSKVKKKISKQVKVSGNPTSFPKLKAAIKARLDEDAAKAKAKENKRDTKAAAKAAAKASTAAKGKARAKPKDAVRDTQTDPPVGPTTASPAPATATRVGRVSKAGTAGHAGAEAGAGAGAGAAPRPKASSAAAQPAAAPKAPAAPRSTGQTVRKAGGKPGSKAGGG